jgi:hypothetical protein
MLTVLRKSSMLAVSKKNTILVVWKNSSVSKYGIEEED